MLREWQQKAMNGQEMEITSSLKQLLWHRAKRAKQRKDLTCCDVSITRERHSSPAAAPSLENMAKDLKTGWSKEAQYVTKSNIWS